MIGAGAVVWALALGRGGEPALVGSVLCEGEAVRVQTPIVRAQVDGVHLQVVNSGAARPYEVRSDDALPTTGVLPEDGVVDLVLPLAPGVVGFTCFRAGSGEPVTASFELQDPDGLWQPGVLACDRPESGVFVTTYAEEPFGRTARRAVLGLVAADRLVKPGYPGTAWHGELHVVVRGDRVIARIVRVLNHGRWSVTVDACPGSGLTRGAVAETGPA
jgi:hypothetical protein